MQSQFLVVSVKCSNLYNVCHYCSEKVCDYLTQIGSDYFALSHTCLETQKKLLCLHEGCCRIQSQSPLHPARLLFHLRKAGSSRRESPGYESADEDTLGLSCNSLWELWVPLKWLEVTFHIFLFHIYFWLEKTYISWTVCYQYTVFNTWIHEIFDSQIYLFLGGTHDHVDAVDVIVGSLQTLSLSSPLGPITLSKRCFPTWESTADKGSSSR